ncbi:universal stress protein [Mycobacterium sp. PSTR-4-N]|uniref:universal stress protein n=1 Tax=Mycobacterium sp. PSTR-4-N TaxID=2917745 RepID=UPI001F154D9D|nr:universal stress protein [Mycobacterium sp. PSTR-4-N]MCG7593010.1 universal stress protein [Mycobacterium sp. PSTR-4-N]
MSARPSSRGVLVGVDGSASATAALRWAVAEARVRATTLCVVHVAADTDDVLDEAVAIATTDTVDEAPHVTGVRLAGSPAGVLARQSQDAEMVVVGRHGDATRLHRLLGSVTTGVLHHAHCPVAVVHADPTPTGASIHTNRQPVLVGVDGSRWSAAAVEVAFAEASARGVGVLALYVCDEAEQTPEARRRSSFWIEEGQEILAQALAPLRQRHPTVPVHTLIRFEDPARQLLTQGERAQLIVVGSHGRGAVAGLLLGSVSTAVASEMRNPVIVVRCGHRAT